MGLESQEWGDPKMGLFQVFWAAGSPATGMAFPGGAEEAEAGEQHISVLWLVGCWLGGSRG